jgi:hypothetical protein
MTPAEHYAEAERLIEVLHGEVKDANFTIGATLQLIQARATLALYRPATDLGDDQ